MDEAAKCAERVCAAVRELNEALAASGGVVTIVAALHHRNGMMTYIDNAHETTISVERCFTVHEV